MARDDRIKMRNALVIPGGLLAFYSLVGIIYAESFRAKSDFCPDSNLILINDVCYTVWKLLTPLLLLGLGLLVAGLVVFRSEPDDLQGHLHHGTGTHFTLALLISLVGVPFIGWVIQTVRQSGGRGPFVLEFQNVQYEHTFVLELVMLLGILMLVPFLGLYIMGAMRRRAFLQAAEAALEEPPLPHEEGFEHGDAMPEAEVEADMDDGTDWPDERDQAEPVPEPTPQPEPMPQTELTRAPTPQPEPTPPPAGTEPAPARSEPPPGPESEPSKESGYIGCQAHLADGASCENSTHGKKYCHEHACHATTKAGNPCKNQAVEGSDFCRVH